MTGRTAAPCGTIAGRKRHRDRGEDVCQPCKDAWNAYQAQYRRDHPEYDTRHHRIRSRALNRLAREYPERFKALFAEERDRDSPAGRASRGL